MSVLKRDLLARFTASRESLPMAAGDAADDESVHDVIAAHARGRAPSELWTTSVGGAMNAVLLWSQFPGLRWLAGAFVAIAAYGAWGLADRRLAMLPLQEDEPRGAVPFVKLIRGMAGATGWVAALYALMTFMNAALGGLSLPGR